jgi:hypothetical protein
MKDINMKTIKLIALTLAMSVSINSFASTSTSKNEEISTVEEQSRVSQVLEYVLKNKVKCAVFAVGTIATIAAGTTLGVKLYQGNEPEPEGVLQERQANLNVFLQNRPALEDENIARYLVDFANLGVIAGSRNNRTIEFQSDEDKQNFTALLERYDLNDDAVVLNADTNRVAFNNWMIMRNYKIEADQFVLIGNRRRELGRYNLRN